MTSLHAARRAASHRYLLPAALGLALVVALPANADSVTDWNALAMSQVMPRIGAPPQQARALALLHISMHDALNTIQPRYETYNALPAAAAGASANAAVAAASRWTLLALIDALPAPSPALPPAAIQAEWDARALAINNINAAYNAAIGPGAPDAAEAAGIAAGEAAAMSCFTPRHVHNGLKWVPTDGSQAPNAAGYNEPAVIGRHQPTPTLTGITQPAFTSWGSVQLFSINSPSQFRAPPAQLFDTTSQFYADEYNEVKHQGDARIRGAFPNSEKSDIARFWPAGGLEWNATMRQISAARGLDLWQNARLFALASVSASDSLVTLFSAKYHYKFWRPVTAIRAAADGNPLTASDPTWMPFFHVTPPYPDYPCGSTSNTGAVTQTLRRFFGTNAISFSRTVMAPPVPLPSPLSELPAKPITRKYMSLSIAENEQARARVYEGYHFAEGCYAGIKSGNQVADWVYTHEFRPL